MNYCCNYICIILYIYIYIYTKNIHMCVCAFTAAYAHSSAKMLNWFWPHETKTSWFIRERGEVRDFGFANVDCFQTWGLNCHQSNRINSGTMLQSCNTWFAIFKRSYPIKAVPWDAAIPAQSPPYFIPGTPWHPVASDLSLFENRAPWSPMDKYWYPVQTFMWRLYPPIPSQNQTWQWQMVHLWNFMNDCPLKNLPFSYQGFPSGFPSSLPRLMAPEGSWFSHVRWWCIFSMCWCGATPTLRCGWSSQKPPVPIGCGSLPSEWQQHLGWSRMVSPPEIMG